MKLIVLAAGDAFELDGFNKLLIRHPKHRKTILEIYKDLFEVNNIEIVVGYKSMDVMNLYPDFVYKYNKNWQTTSSGYSLSLALSEEPCIVVPSDVIIDEKTIELMSTHENCALVKNTENRRPSSLNATIREDKSIGSVYKGLSRSNDPELIGVFKISEPSLLKSWRKQCLLNSQGYAGENLPTDTDHTIQSIESSNSAIEINTPQDYINFLEENRA